MGYQNGSRDINRHVAEEDRQNYRNGTFESNRGMTIINESGLYSLILSSKLESAKAFKHWVTAEVLPTIRKTGGYINHGQEDLFIDTYILYLPVICSILILSRSEGGTDMKKNLKKYLIILLAAIMIFSLPLSASAATKKNVTKTYKKSVTRMLRGFDSYFGYCCGKNQYFKFDNYARTTMVRMRNYGLSSDKASYVKKKLRPQLKLYFNTSTVKFKKFTKYGIPRNPSYLFCNKNGRIVYTGGDWGEVAPKGFVKKIIRTSSNRYEVTYSIYEYDDWAKKNYGHMGTYKIYLKKAKNKNGFVITNIKQTASKKVSL